jgi:hypothetical protein
VGDKSAATQSPLLKAFWQYRYNPCHGSAGEENLSRGSCHHFVADDTVESSISFTDFIIKKEVMELKQISYCSHAGTNYLGKQAVKEYIFKQGAYLKN